RDIEVKYEIQDDRSVDISYVKKKPGSYFLKVVFPILENSYPTIYQDVVEFSSGNLLRLQPIDPDKSIRFSMSYNYIRGVPNPKVDTAFQYVLPFKNHKKIVINEASNLNEVYFGAQKPIDWKAYIVYSNKADTVCSMRKGIVIELNNTFLADHSVGNWYSSQRNHIIIEHEDGTIAEYKGFKKNSFFVKIGQTVYPQTNLGVMEVSEGEKHRLDFNVRYLYDASFEKKKKVTMKDYINRERFLSPYFVTANGVHKLKDREIYVSESNPTVLLAEFSKKEKKKYKKSPELFH
ncbi:hypothetical protein, partial [Lutimonas sp.]|uniref:hypothetical protein n=1 Tax=Lutimonas sp. TaxID=1872403 RepID=UPI003D9B3521